MKKKKHFDSAEKDCDVKLNTASADNFDADDFDMVFAEAENREKAETLTSEKKQRKNIFTLSNLILLICLICFAVCAVVLFSRWFDYRRSDELYQSLSDQVLKEVSNDPSYISSAPSFSPQPTINDYQTILNSGVSLGEIAQSKEINIEFERVKAKLEEIKRINSDIVGWIRIEGTQVNYPIVLGTDNDYYLTHAYNGEYLRSGTIFADYRSFSPLSSNPNIVLYGHNMANGAMFAAVKKFLNEDFFNSHVIEIYTFDGIYTFEPFAMLNTDTSIFYNRPYFNSEVEFKAFVDDMYSRSMFKKDINLSSVDKIITLSTCNTYKVTARYALMGRLIKVEGAE